MRKLSFFSVFIFLLSSAVFAQEEDYKTMFLEAESYFLFEEYKDALPNYLKLLKAFPENSNLEYRIGVCYLNDPLQKQLSINYLENAVKNTTQNYKENSLKETKAPYEALFYLGNAYRVNNQLDKALKTYEKFKQNLDTKIYDLDLVNEQIEACKNASRQEKNPLDVIYTNLGEPINTRFNDINPVVNSSETSMVYVQQQQFYDAVFYSTKLNGEWQPPRNIMFELGFDKDIYPTSLSADGTELYLYGVDNFLGTIFVSNLVNGQWTKARRLNDNINTKYWESHASISHDGKSLYFTSNRKGGFGGLDIYVSHRDAKGDWGPPVNLGGNINTRYNEESPFITEDGNTLYFSSYGHNSMGGYDVFYSNLLENGEWSVPVNAGYPINTPDDDEFFVPVQNGTFAYYSRYFEGLGQGRMDIYRYEIFSDTHPHKFLIKGAVSLKGAAENDLKNILISVYDRNKKDTIQRALTDENGAFSINLPAGDFDISYSLKGFKSKIDNLTIPKGYKEGTHDLSATLQAIEKTVPEPVKEAPAVPGLLIPEKYLESTVGQTVNININFNRPGTLFINARADSVLVKSESIAVKKGDFNYPYKVAEGKNIIEFKLIDNNNQESVEYVVINGAPGNETENKLVTTIPSLSGSDNPSLLLDGLKALASGNLKKLLDKLDLQKAHIAASSELIKYLLLNADEGRYSQQDVIDLLTVKASHLSLQELVNQLSIYADGNLKNALMTLDLKKEGITSESQLIDYLLESTARYGYTRQDVYNMLSRAAANGNPNAKDLLRNLQQYASPGLKKILLGLNLDSLKIRDAGQLVEYLLSNTGKLGYSQEDVIRALLDMVSSMPVDQFRKKMAEYSTGNLRAVLESLNPGKENIRSVAELIQWLLKQAPQHGYTQNDVINALIKMALASADNVSGLLKAMQENSSPNLKKMLLRINPAELQLTSNNDLVDYLTNKARENGYQVEDVLHALEAIAYNGNATDAQYNLLRLSDSDLRKIILKVDPKASNIGDIPGLMTFLQKDLSSKQIPDSVYGRLVDRFLACNELQYVLEKLRKMAQGNLKSTLESVDPYQEKLSSLTSLVNYLVRKSTSSGYAPKEIFALLEKYRESLLLDGFIKDALSSVSDSLLSAIAGFDPYAYHVYSRDSFLIYLLNASSSFGYPADSVHALVLQMPGYTELPADLLLSNLEQTKIKDKLRGLNLENNNYQKGTDLIQYLLSKRKLSPEQLAAAINDAENLMEMNEYLSWLQERGHAGIKSLFSNFQPLSHKVTSAERLSDYILVLGDSDRIDMKEASLLLATMIDRMKTRRYMQHLSENTSNDFGILLESLIRENTFPDSLESLLPYLLNQSKLHGYSSGIVYRLVVDQMSATELERFIERMIAFSHGALREALLTMDIRKMKLNSPAEIIAYLEKKASGKTFTLGDIREALTKTAGSMVNNALQRMAYMETLKGKNWFVQNLPASVALGLLFIVLVALLYRLSRAPRKKD